MHAGAKKAFLFIATGCYVGLTPRFPGTLGTLVAIPIFLLVGPAPPVHLTLALVLLVIAIPLGDWAERHWGCKDPQAFVLDEIVGYLFGVLLIPWPPAKTLLWGFVLFRVFDGLKPYPIRRIERLSGGAGIVLDDLLAGVYTNLALRFLAWLTSSL
ncbi:MAG: phosphatidylglycerophosphatase A [Planctomycetes bacterium]|nr:phosphatidylglycerophosphatase A [Planctomycetota bacterium]